MNDPLTRAQLMAQKKRRTELLKKLKAEGAPPAAIAQAEKQLKLTKLRLEKLKKEKQKKEQE